MTLSWIDPEDFGGCSLQGFELYRDDGAGGAFVQIHATDLDDDPMITSFTVTDLPASPDGLTVYFKLKAINTGSYYIESDELEVTVGDAPVVSTAPTADPDSTSSSSIKIIFNAATSTLTIINYEVQMDDGEGGGFATVAGGDLGTHLVQYFHGTSTGSRLLWGRSLTAIT